MMHELVMWHLWLFITLCTGSMFLVSFIFVPWIPREERKSVLFWGIATVASMIALGITQ